jgi:uncharacterized protein (DUF1015 family)
MAQPRDGSEYSIRHIEAADLGAIGDQHRLAAERYRAWRREGVLRQDPEPAIYVHRHEFPLNGRRQIRTGLLARVRLHDWEERVVLPHERTMDAPRLERLDRLRAVAANLSPLYLLFRDQDGAIRDLIAAYQAQAGEPVPDEDRMGGAHRLAAITDPAAHRRLAEVFATRTLFVADGHHRYEAALAYRNERRLAAGADRDAPAEFVLALLAPLEDPGVIVRPAHRVLLDAPADAARALAPLLRRWFDVRRATGPLPAADSDGFMCRVVLPGEGGRWDVFALPGAPHSALLPRDRGLAWRSLGVAAVTGLLESAFGADRERTNPNVVAAIDEAEATRQVESGAAAAAFLLPAPSLDRVLAVAEEHDLLPPKSTWFEPKAPAGLVINDLNS